MKKRIKQGSIAFFAVALVLFLLASGYLLTDKYVTGIQNFSLADCSLSLTAKLFPSENFLQEYPYVEGDYTYRYDGKIGQNRAAVFAAVTYSKEAYAQAKAFCLQQFILEEQHCFSAGTYRFMEHLCHTKANDQGVQEAACGYPKCFNLFGFDDASGTLLFLGYYSSKEDESTMLAQTDFEAFFNGPFAEFLQAGEK